MNFTNKQNLMNRMKLLIFALFLSSVPIFAQDVITLRNGDQIQAQVTEISATEIRYRLPTQPEGPIRVISTADVFSVDYQDGTREVFNPLTETNVVQTATAQQPTATEAEQPIVETTETSVVRKNVFGISHSAVMLGEGVLVPTLGLLYQRNISDFFRIEASFSHFYLPHIERSDIIVTSPTTAMSFLTRVGMWDTNVNGHFLLPLSDSFGLYALGGFGVAGLRVRMDTTTYIGRESTDTRGEWVGDSQFGLNVGFGMDWERVSFEFSYKYLPGVSDSVLSIGGAWIFR